MVVIKTSKGDIKLKLDTQNTPKTTENFLSYVSQGFYDNTIFHRVIKGFMIQGGGLTESMETKTTQSPIENEAVKAYANKRGTISMARTMDPHSATSQFFINVADNNFLNYSGEHPSNAGYCVFGEVTEGMDVVDAIEKAQTGHQQGHDDVPVEPIVIHQIIEEK